MSSMDSYNFHFERMSNLDLHPLSLPVSRLSPAKSSSSIVDQLTHHQHGKGDSAYSSFSGGSTAPDYPSPFLPDDLQSSSFSHYADLKYVKSICHPTQSMQSDSKTMDQLYRSVEAISQHYRNNTSTSVNHQNHNGNGSFHANNKALCKQEVPLGAPSQTTYPPVQPPPVPARMDSFIATKNLENSRVHHGTNFQPQQPQPQQQPRPYIRLHSQQHGLNARSPEKANPDTGSSSFNKEPVYSVWGGSSQQPPPSYRHHLQPNDQNKVPLNPEHLFIIDNKDLSKQQKSTNVRSSSPPRRTNQSELLKPRQLSTSGGSNGDHHKPNGSSSHFASQRKRSHSAQDWLGSEVTRAASPWTAGESVINSSIQHKGQFYFVTGVCKHSDSGMRTYSASVCGSEAGSESSTVSEKYRIREKERSHSTMDDLFRPLQESSHFFSDMIPDEREVFFSVSQDKEISTRGQDQENHRPSLALSQSTRSLDTLEEMDMMENREIGRHSTNNPIFFCGPDSPPHSSTQTNEVTSQISREQHNHHKREDQAKRGKCLSLGDVASEKINKETTPLLYHLTEANRAILQPRKDTDFSIKSKEAIFNQTGHGDVAINNNERPIQNNMKSDKGEITSVACNTLDDSFKKYYKEKLKDAQSKVLRETSFKRRDLQLSWPHRVRQKPELRPAIIHTFSPSLDSETSTDTLTPSVTSEETERGSIKEEVKENKKDINQETEKENGRPANVAQPQVAHFGGRRKRLTPEQKKMCYSEPEKLNDIGNTPKHSACRSFGNESEYPFAAECEGEEREQQGEQGLVAARRKMFETRGRAFSASSASKTNLKHLQHKALVEYMERKTGHKVAEPQQPSAQLPPPPRQRHSLGEKPFDWGPRPASGNNESKITKKKFHRPHSAGRILDSSASSIRYAQFFSAQSCSGQYAGQSSQPRWRESQGPSQGKSASVESLLDQPERISFFRNRSTSTPQALEVLILDKKKENGIAQKNTTEDTMVKSLSEGQRQVRVVTQRGKSMEELGTSTLTKLSAMSKSSEQLDHLWRHSTGPAGLERDQRSVSFIAEVKKAQGSERARKQQYVRQEPEKEEGVSQKNSQGQIQNQTQKKPLLKQNSDPVEESTEGVRSSNRSTSPASCSSSRSRALSVPHCPATDEFRTSRLPSETLYNPSSPRGAETSEREIKPSILPQAGPGENRPILRVKNSPSVSGSEREQSVDETNDDAQPPEPNHEVSLSCGITTDPSLWVPPPEEEIKKDSQNPLLNDSISDDESTCSVPQTQTTSCSSITNTDVTQQVEEDKNPSIEDEKLGENQDMEERGAPEGEMESLEGPTERLQWEELVKAVVEADPSLARGFYPLANRKTALMLMEQLLSEDTLLMEEHYKKKQEQRGAAESAETAAGAEAPSSLPVPDRLKPPCTDQQSRANITEKKHLLVSCIKERLHSLEETRAALQAEIQDNVGRGEALEALIRECCLPVELERYNLFIGDLERVVSLLLCLSARLARVQNALSTVDQHTDAEEKQSLDSRHRLLCKQREDAKDLKDNLDRRENLVSTFLSRQLSAEQLQDYRRFVQTKASLLIRQKDVEERQRLGEEQLEALSNSLSL
ncbi:protein Shroom1 isoform X2 [Echeneis naucrates]|uniref:protein Shroom1 isoform X2 n=1 Tax=Echeneis naucrates TaxID=173247 RepID=UPI001113E77A|nr:protein Shroom1-like isoform X2 [Echeneis naucrates]